LEGLLYGVLLTAVLSLLLNIVLKRFDLPVIIGYILTGAVISQLFHLHETHRQHLFEVAEFGIVFLMFTVGLEFPLVQLKRLRREVFVFGTLQVVLSMALFSLLGIFLFGLEQKAALIVGGALALSSTAIVLKMLQESGDIATGYGRQALGILLFQDLAVIPLLLMVSLFAQNGQSPGLLIAQAVVSGAAAIVILYLFGRYVLESYFNVVNDTHSQEIFISSIFIIVLGSAALSYALGFSYTLGAFFAGIMIAETRYKMQVEINFVPFRDMLLGIFFISVGLQLRFDFLADNFMTVLLLMGAVMCLKTALLFGILRLSNPAHISMKTALTLSQVGEFSFAILGFSLRDGLITPALSQTLIIAVVFSMILTPFMFKRLGRLTAWFEPASPYEPLNEPIEEMRQHIVVIGYGKLGQHIVRHLEALGVPYVAVDFHANLVQEGEKRGHNVRFGDANSPSALEHLHIQNARAVLIAIYDENRIPYLIDLLDAYRNRLTVIARISDFSQENLLTKLDSRFSVNENDIVARAMVEKAMEYAHEKEE